ncbi:MAG TPA: hypothetical protein V6C52_12000 [Coleofasciculaceae cyanobacterium]|jgi:hypothetical protein
MTGIDRNEYKNLLHFLAAFLGISLVFSSALATAIVLPWKGIPILQHGIPMCGILAQEQMWDRILYTSCGCALVEIVLFPLSLAALKFSAPRLFRQFAYVRRQGKRMIQPK